LVCQRIDHCSVNTWKITQPVHRGGLRGKLTPQRVAGRARKTEPLNRQIEVEVVHALAILHGVDDAQVCLDAERSEALDERHVVRLERRLVEQELDADRLALRRHPLSVLDDEASPLPERARLTQERTILTRSIGSRRDKRISEQLIGQLVAE